MQKTTFIITKMDCPSEENLIRMKLDQITTIQHLDFDISNRKLIIFHLGETELITAAILSLKLGGQLVETVESQQNNFVKNAQQSQLLWIVLAINFLFFIIEITSGLVSQSMGLVADSLDMLADSFVYGISLLAVGKTLIQKKKIAKLAGYFQIILAIIGLVEVLRRFLGAEEIPHFSTMITVSFGALIANGFCLYLLQKSQSKEEAHMKASLIFTSNDIIINLGVILAGGFVYLLQSPLPDLFIGIIVFVLVLQGAVRILRI